MSRNNEYARAFQRSIFETYNFRLRTFATAWSGYFGGADRDRTDDLKLAKLALSQLSYGPFQLREGLSASLG